MAIRFDTASEILYRTANLPSLAGPWTICLWHYRVGNVTYAGVCAPLCSNSPPSFFGTTSQLVCYSSAGTALQLYDNNALKATGSSPTLATWYPIWLQRGAATNRTDVYFNRGTSPDMQGTTSFSTAAASGIGLGGIGVESVNVRAAALKWWSALLTNDEMVRESFYYVPIRQTNLEGWYPLIDDIVATNTTDYSGLGRSLTSGGTLTVEDGPPIAWAPVSDPWISMAAAPAAPVGKAPPPFQRPWRVLRRRRMVL